MTDDPARRGVQAFAEGDYEGALEAYLEAVDATPDDADAWNGLTMTYYKMQRFEHALEAALKLLSFDEKNMFAWTNLSLIYQRLDRIEEAEHAGAKARVIGWSEPGASDPPA